MASNEPDEKQNERRRFLSLGALSAMGATGLILATSASASAQDKSATPSQPQTPTSPPAKDPGIQTQDLAVKAGTFTRTGNELQAWNRTRSLIEGELKPTIDGSSSGALVPFSRRIESGFRSKGDALEEEFSLLHVEPLIDQAADLLDRGLRDRAVWDDQAVKWLQLALELGEYKELDVIHADEEGAGLYDVPSKQSIAEYVAEDLNAKYQQVNENMVENLISTYLNVNEIYKVHNAAIKSAWLTGCLPYRFDGQVFAGYVQHSYAGVSKDVADHAYDAALDLSWHQLMVELGSQRLQKEVFDTLTEVSKRRLPGLKAKSDWDSLNANFMRRRTLVARKYQDIKSRAATEVDGLLNYQKRLVPLKERFHSDFNYALRRLTAVRQGLSIIFGYNEPFPSDANAIDYFDKCLQWTRSAVQWLIRFSRQDQSLVLPISLRTLLGDTVYKQQRETGLWEVVLDENLFPDLRHVRLRGITVFVEGDDATNKLWQMTARPPLQSSFSHLSNKSVKIDQSQIPVCRLGRITGRDSRREPDVVGMSSLYNASPIGTWGVRVNGSVPAEKLDKLKDVVIDLHLAYRSLPMKKGV